MTLYRRAAWASGIAVAVCVAVLLTDAVLSVRIDAAAASKLAADQKRVTDFRLARKSRDAWLSWLLIASSLAFLTCAKKVVGQDGILRRIGNPPAAPLAGCQPAAGFQPAPQVSPSPLDLSFVESAVAQHGRSPESAIPLLQALQAHYRYLPDEALRRLCELTAITPAQIAGASSFYGQFRRRPVGEHLVRVCHGTACHVSGARQITDELRRYLSVPADSDTDPSRTFTIEEVACLGCCSLAPVLMIDGRAAGNLTPASARDALSGPKPVSGRGVGRAVRPQSRIRARLQPCRKASKEEGLQPLESPRE